MVGCCAEKTTVVMHTFQMTEDVFAAEWIHRLLIPVAVLLAVGSLFLFRWMRQRFGMFKTVLTFVIVGISVTLFTKWYVSGFFNIRLNIAGDSVPNCLPIALILAGTAALLIACLLGHKARRFSKVLIVGIYVCSLLFCVGKMAFYNEKVANTPDEIAHIGYVAYLEQTGEILPTLENMKMTKMLSSDTEVMRVEFVDGSVNHLRHPPLYYHVMRLAGGIEFAADGTFTVDLDRIRGCSMLVATSAIGLMFYIGYSRLKKRPLLHMLYATVIVSVPMLTYGASGVNNDTLVLLTVTVFFLGILRYSEKKRNVWTYLLIALGMSLTLLTKMTAGIIVIVAAVLVLAITLWREKCWKELLSWPFLVTVPLYIVAAAYYLITLAQYGSFQPSLDTLNADYANMTGFYPPVEQRPIQSLFSYAPYFLTRFMQSWAGIFSYVRLLKEPKVEFLEMIVSIVVWVAPLALLCKPIRTRLPHVKSIAAVYIGAVVTLLLQLANGYNGLVERGYMSGFQSRYYICVIAMFALCIALLVQKFYEHYRDDCASSVLMRHIATCGIVAFIELLVYGDFVYFLLHFTSYLG